MEEVSIQRRAMLTILPSLGLLTLRGADKAAPQLPWVNPVHHQTPTDPSMQLWWSICTVHHIETSDLLVHFLLAWKLSEGRGCVSLILRVSRAPRRFGYRAVLGERLSRKKGRRSGEEGKRSRWVKRERWGERKEEERERKERKGRKKKQRGRDREARRETGTEKVYGRKGQEGQEEK